MARKSLEYTINLIFWLGSGWLIISSFSIESQEIEILNGVRKVQVSRDTGLILDLLCLVIASALMFYANFLNLLNLNRYARRSKSIGLSVFIFIQGYILYLAGSHLLVGLFPLFREYALSITVYVFYYTVSTAYGLAKVWSQTEARNRQLALEKKQAEINFLRAQLHPHFLFNVLNNLLAMVDQLQHPALARAIDQLSSLLRHVVYESTSAKIPLHKEISFIEAYAALHKLSFEEEEISFDLTVDVNLKNLQIEPGIFVPFIENAFTYGTYPEERSHIQVIFRKKDPQMLYFSVKNPIYPALREKKKGGTGIASVKNRLDLVYPGRYTLRMDESDTFFVELDIDFHESDHNRR